MRFRRTAPLAVAAVFAFSACASDEAPVDGPSDEPGVDAPADDTPADSIVDGVDTEIETEENLGFEGDES